MATRHSGAAEWLHGLLRLRQREKRHGGYSGFSEYYARLYPDATGAFTKAYVQAMGEDSDDYSTGVASTACKMAGYGSITLQ